MRRATFYLVLVVAALAVLLLAGCAGKQSEGLRPEALRPAQGGAQPEGETRPSVSTPQPSPPVTETGQSSTSDWDLSPRRNDAGRVVVDVTPLTLSDDTWEFGMAFNTHSVNLGFDVTEVSVLRCDQGQEYKPTAWNGPGPGGHHRSGVLKFAALDHSTSFVEIVIRDVAEVPERVFRWDLPSRAESSPGGSTAQSSPTVEDGPAHLALLAEEFNFGDVAMSVGVVSATMNIINNGSGTLRVEGVEPT